MEKLHEVLPNSLNEFDLVSFQVRHSNLLQVARHLKDLMKSGNDNQLDAFTEDIIDHLDVLIYSCDQAKFKTIYQEYLSRWMYLLLIQSFGYYTALNPGITHKAGVPVGGTFILVYHQKEPQAETPDRLANASLLRTGVLSTNAFKNVINKVSGITGIRDDSISNLAGIDEVTAAAEQTTVDELIREWPNLCRRSRIHGRGYFHGS